MNRFDRVTAILIQLQAKRVVTGPALAKQFSISLRTIYRDLHTLELAGVPICGEPGVGYSLADGYRLPPIMFTFQEAIALLTAEKLAAQLTDSTTALLSSGAMDKLRAVMRKSDRDQIELLSPSIRVVQPNTLAPNSNAYQQLLSAITQLCVVQLSYATTANNGPTLRLVEPIGLYMNKQWHLIAYCRLRNDFRDFLLNKIVGLTLTSETYKPRIETLDIYWDRYARQAEKTKVVVHFDIAALLPEQAQQLHHTKPQYGFVSECQTADQQLLSPFW